MVGSSSLQGIALVEALPRGAGHPYHSPSPLTAELLFPPRLGSWLLSRFWFFSLLGLFAFALLTRDPEKKTPPDSVMLLTSTQSLVPRASLQTPGPPPAPMTTLLPCQLAALEPTLVATKAGATQGDSAGPDC